jgi:hypothetical protein
LPRRALLLNFVVGAGLAAAILSYRLADLRDFPATEVRAFSIPRYDGQTFQGGLDSLLAGNDGYSFVAVAMDPLLQHPESFSDRATASYRAQRPLLPWLAGASALGSEDGVRVAMVGWNIVAAGVVAAAAGILIARRGAAPGWGIVAVALPGSFACLWWCIGDLVGLAALAVGLVAWTGTHRRRGLAVAALIAAVLGREVAVLVPIVLAWRAWRRGERDEMKVLAVPIVVGVAWQLIVRIAYGAWPFAGAPPGGGTVAPLVGLWQGVGDWALVDVLFAVALVLLFAAFLRRSDVEGWQRDITVAFLLASLVAGPFVWGTWRGFTRILLPASYVALVAIVPRRDQPSAPEAITPRP